MYFTRYRVSNKDKVATESEPAHGTKVQGPRWGRGTVRCSVLFIHTRVIHSYQVVVGGSEGRGGEKARMCVLFVSLSESAVRREPV